MPRLILNAWLDLRHLLSKIRSKPGSAVGVKPRNCNCQRIKLNRCGTGTEKAQAGTSLFLGRPLGDRARLRWHGGSVSRVVKDFAMLCPTHRSFQVLYTRVHLTVQALSLNFVFQSLSQKQPKAEPVRATKIKKRCHACT